MARDVEVTPLRLARVELPDFHPKAPGHDTVYGFLVRTGSDCVLVDTGIGADAAVIERLYAPERAPLPDALREAGASVADVTAVVNSHLHFDHCGNNRLFPDVPIFVQQAELEAARQPHYTVPDWVDFPGATYVPVRGRHRLSDALELHPTPGHTPGHQSLVVRSAGWVEIVAAQAAYCAAEFRLAEERAEAKGDAALREYVRSNASWSEEAYVDSLSELRRLRPDRAWFSHDGAAWERESARGPGDAPP